MRQGNRRRHIHFCTGTHLIQWNSPFVGQNFPWEEIQLNCLYIYPWEEGMTKDKFLAIRYPSSPLPLPSGHFGQTLTERDPIELFFWALLLDMVLLGT